jgi:predicted nucleic acid-binding protein
MSAEFFIDSNIAIYGMDVSSAKGRIALKLINARPSISGQVVMECVNVLIRKQQLPKSDAFEYGKLLLFNSKLAITNQKTILTAFEISNRYQYSHWDSLIIASALEARCSTLYSEDLRDGQIIEKNLTIRNPFIHELTI